MGILDNFEKGLERAVNGAFAKTFKSGLQPVEITSALRRELDTKAAVVARDRILAPNRFTVRLSPADYVRIAGIGPSLISELSQLVSTHGREQGYQFTGAITITLAEDANLSVGMVQIDSKTLAGQVAWTPVVDINGTRHTLVKSRTVIGRGTDADITIPDSGTSRRHVEIIWDGARAQVRDLGSTNGSQLNGSPVTQAILEPDSVITIGRTRIVFQVLAQATGPATDSQPQADPGGFWGSAS